MGRLRSFWNWVFRRSEVEAELDAEVRAFYETLVSRYQERGLSEQEARRLARLEFDSPENAKEEVRDARPGARLAACSHVDAMREPPRGADKSRSPIAAQ